MPRLIPRATRIPVPRNKQIDEYVGRVNTNDTAVSIAHTHSPSGWSEPGQTPEFDEYTVVLKGSLRVESKDGVLEVKAGQSVVAPRGEWVRYSTPASKAPNTSPSASPPSTPPRSTRTVRTDSR